MDGIYGQMCSIKGRSELFVRVRVRLLIDVNFESNM